MNAERLREIGNGMVERGVEYVNGKESNEMPAEQKTVSGV